MSLEASPLAAAVPGLVRSDPHRPGMTRVRDEGGFRYLDPSGAQMTDAGTLDRIRALRIPPAWAGNVWISPGSARPHPGHGHRQQGPAQHPDHRLWREQRDAQKFGDMLRFADALPGLRTAAADDLRHRGCGLTRDRVVASVVRLIDLGMFRIGGERYAELDHHYGATTLQKQHVRFTRDGIVFDYTAKWGKQRTIVISDNLVQPTIRALARTDNDLDTLWSYEQDGRWHILHSRDVGNYIAARAWWRLHGQGIPHLERHRADGAGAGERDARIDAHRPQAHHSRQRPRGRGMARRHPGRGPQFLHRPAPDRPLRFRRLPAYHPSGPGRPPRRPRSRDRRRHPAGQLRDPASG